MSSTTVRNQRPHSQNGARRFLVRTLFVSAPIEQRKVFAKGTTTRTTFMNDFVSCSYTLTHCIVHVTVVGYRFGLCFSELIVHHNQHSSFTSILPSFLIIYIFTIVPKYITKMWNRFFRFTSEFLNRSNCNCCDMVSASELTNSRFSCD